MEINAFIREQFGIPSKDIRTYSPLTLAYIGDAVFDLIIRSLVVDKCNTQANKLHQKTSAIVKAGTQATMILALEPLLTPEELEIYHRGRNAKSPTVAKNASVADYRKATGFEAVMGYLYLTDQFDRALELTKAGLSAVNIVI